MTLLVFVNINAKNRSVRTDTRLFLLYKVSSFCLSILWNAWSFFNIRVSVYKITGFFILLFT